ncbi:MAG: transcription elongation factor GreA, partial [Ruminococcus sp.]|nr:transcription elongation factor GreA [Ruminococcus sp.]
MAVKKMSRESYNKLVAELDDLKINKRKEVAERLKVARSYGDLSENAEYDAAREEKRSNEGKIAELEYQIKNAVIQEEITDNSYVHLDSV